jgi:hypothetical protein
MLRRFASVVAGALDELGLDLPSIAHPILDGFPRHDVGVNALEVEALAAVRTAQRNGVTRFQGSRRPTPTKWR